VKRLAAILVTGLFSIQAIAQSCPFTNPRYKDLKASSAKLASALAESADCQGEAQHLSNLGAQLSTLAVQAEASENDPSVTTDQKALLATEIVSHFGQINSAFNSRCGARLRNFLDYTEAFVDTVNGLSPFLALYAGPNAGPWVLGTALGGAFMKAVLTFIRGRGIDMTQASHREAFITHSCSFYNLDRILKSIENAETFGLASLDEDLEMARSRKATLQQLKPERPDLPILAELDATQNVHKKLEEIKTLLNSDPGIACLMIQDHINQLSNGNEDSLGQQILNRYQRHVLDNSAQARWKVKYFQEIELPELTTNFKISALQPEACKQRGELWVNRFEIFNSEAKVALQTETEKIPQLQVLVEWEKEMKSIEQNIVLSEKRREFVLSLSRDGGAFDISEIISNRDEAQKLLFQKIHIFEPILAWQWIKFKREEVQNTNKDASKLSWAIDERLKSTQTRINSTLNPQNLASYIAANRNNPQVSNNVIDDLCAQISYAQSRVYASGKHLEAGFGYCVAFSGLINKQNFSAMHKTCFDERDRRSMKRVRDEVAQSNREIFNYLRQVSEQLECRSTPSLDQLEALSIYAGSKL
jgi:hypothetical protein